MRYDVDGAAAIYIPMLLIYFRYSICSISILEENHNNRIFSKQCYVQVVTAHSWNTSRGASRSAGLLKGGGESGHPTEISGPFGMILTTTIFYLLAVEVRCSQWPPPPGISCGS